MMYKPTLTDIREWIDHFSTDELAAWEHFDINFLREFKDKINWLEVFEKIYATYYREVSKIDCSNSAYKIRIDSFEEFCRGYNKKFFDEYFKHE